MGACCFRSVSEATDQAAGDGNRSHNNRDAGIGVGNKLLCSKPPIWASETPMTRGQLLSKRDAFWDTSPSYSGKPEIWQALRAAAECDDVGTAQVILDAVNVTLPCGNLTLVYDELGGKYEIPPYCLSEPTNLIGQAGASNGSSMGDDGAAGAGVERAVEQLSVKLRLSTTGQDVPWTGPATATVGQLKAHIEAQASLPVARLRCIFGGKILSDSQTLAGAKMVDEGVMIVIVSA